MESTTVAAANAKTDSDLTASTAARTAEIASAPKRPAPKRPARKTATKVAAKVPTKAARPTPKSKAGALAARQEIARIALDAMTAAIVKANGRARTAYLASYSPEEALQILAQMTHHFPTGKAADGSRNWPAALPKPDRSDWR